MTFPSYESYKKSEIGWLGDIPSHWNAIQVRRDLAFLTSGSRGWAEYYSDEGFVFLRIGNLTRDNIDLDLDDIQRVNPPLGSEGDRTEVTNGDVLFSITAYLGSVGVVPIDLERAYVSQHICLARLIQKKLTPKWLAYSVLSCPGKAYLESESYGGTKVQLSLDDIRSFPVALPSKDEQRLITNFLDSETAKIDALITEQERLNELLQEKRQAVISHATTKGLDPNAPMKDSGVEWLREVPRHWEMRKFGWDFQSGMGQTILKTDLEETGIPIYSATEDNSIFGFLENPSVRLEAGDIVIPARGNCIGAVKMMKEPASCTQTTIYCKIRSEAFSPAYVFFYLQAYREHLFPMTRTAIPQITVGEVLGNRITCPPLLEQKKIEENIINSMNKLNKLIENSQAAIALLKEHRSALISSAVTGQIDVRKLVPENEVPG